MSDLAALTEIDERAGLRHLGLHVALIISLAALTWAAHWLFLFPLGLCLGALFPLMHEASHRHIFRSPKANARLAFVCGVVLLLPATWFRHFHQAHHRYTQDPERDPELAQPRPQTRLAYLWHLSGLPTWRASIILLIRQAGGRAEDAFVPERAHWQIIAEARLILGVHIALIILVFVMPRLLMITYLPLLVGQVFLRAFLLAEHGGLPFVANVMDNTRTTHAAGWLRWLTWNISFHTEHHANPAVPHDKLPAFHERLKPVACASYGKFHRGYWKGLEET